MKNFRTEGIIIKRKNYGEADRILTVLTKQYGKIRVKASGIRRIPSRRSAHVELLNLSVLYLYRGRNYPILTEAQTIDSFASVKENFEAIGKAFYLCEVVDSLCPENQENADVYNLLKKELQSLDGESVCKTPAVVRDGAGDEGYRAGESKWPARLSDKVSVKDKIRSFEIELLSMLGFLPEQSRLRNAASGNFDTRSFIENILERRLKSADVFSRI